MQTNLRRYKVFSNLDTAADIPNLDSVSEGCSVRVRGAQ